MSRKKYKKCSGFGERIRSLRGKLNQSEFAGLFGLTWKKVSDYENERSEPPYTFLVDLSDRFAVTIDWIVKGESSSRRQVAEAVADFDSRGSFDFRSEEERQAVEKAVEALVQLAYSYFEYADEAQADELRRLMTRAELDRYRRRGKRVLTKRVGKTNFEQPGTGGFRGSEDPARKIVDVEGIIQDALTEAGPDPKTGFRPDWDAKAKAEKAVDHWLKKNGWAIDSDQWSRLIDALAMMDEREFARMLEPETRVPRGMKK